MTTKAHNLYRYLKEKYNIDSKDEDTNLFIRLYNLSDEDFDTAVRGIVYDHIDHGLHGSWD